jgi:ATP-dependent DNA ligase
MAEIGHIYAKRNGHLIRLRWDGKGWMPDEPIPAPKAKPFRPMLAESYAGGLRFPVIAQPKLDGVRCIARADGLFSRHGKPITNQPHIVEALAPLFERHPDLILDGELWHPDLTLGEIVSLMRRKAPSTKLSFWAFDYVAALPCNMRLERLASMVATVNAPAVQLVPSTVCKDQDALDAHYDDCLSRGLEGQMIRAPRAPYRQTRCKELLKRKPREDAEAVVVKVEVREAGKLVATLRREDGLEFTATVSGKAPLVARLTRMAPHLGGLEATYSFTGHYPSGHPREATVKMIHEFPRM